MQVSRNVKIAESKNRNSIRKDVYRIRQQLHLDEQLYVNIVDVLELGLPVIDPQFHLIPVEEKELLGRYAETKPSEHAIFVRESVYNAACRGVGWARMILAHELGHYYYHDAASVTYAYLDRNAKISPDIDPERQADIFAAEFLAPSGEIKGMSVLEVQKACGVSKSAAQNQLRQCSNIARRQKKKKAVRQKA